MLFKIIYYSLYTKWNKILKDVPLFIYLYIYIYIYSSFTKSLLHIDFSPFRDK